MGKTTTAVCAAAVVSLLVGGLWWYCFTEWTAWHDFAASYIQEDGRVIDFRAADRSTSEGQAYGLFFALIADEEQRFENLLRWTEDNLAQGDLGSNLPAWLWGLDEAGNWRVLDTNPASDADLWLAYSLLEAGRLWQRQDYTQLADSLLQQIEAREVVSLPGGGPMVLPAPHGFRLKQGGWRFNPSYLPGFILERFAQHDPSGPWAAIRQTAHTLLQQAAPQGLAPDWYVVTPAGEVREDPETGPYGGYEAIRVYLWAGLWPGTGLDSLALVQGMARVIAQTETIPERVNTRTGETENVAPPGFHGALLPYWQRLEERKMNKDHLANSLDNQLGRAGSQKTPQDYYGRVLELFGSGWFNDHYRIDEHGRTSPRWSRNCCEILH